MHPQVFFIFLWVHMHLQARYTFAPARNPRGAKVERPRIVEPHAAPKDGDGSSMERTTTAPLIHISCCGAPVNPFKGTCFAPFDPKDRVGRSIKLLFLLTYTQPTSLPLQTYAHRTRCHCYQGFFMHQPTEHNQEVVLYSTFQLIHNSTLLASAYSSNQIDFTQSILNS